MIEDEEEKPDKKIFKGVQNFFQHTIKKEVKKEEKEE